MSTEPAKRHESVIQIAMVLAEKNGYPVDAWRLFEAQAEATLTRMSKPEAPPPLAPSISPEHHHDQLDDAQPLHPHIV
jgi:hypothetical protein